MRVNSVKSFERIKNLLMEIKDSLEPILNFSDDPIVKNQVKYTLEINKKALTLMYEVILHNVEKEKADE